MQETSKNQALKKDSYHVIGVMSGTSLDGIDLVYVHFYQPANWRFQLQKAETIPYTPGWREKLQQAPQLSPVELQNLNLSYSLLVAETIGIFIKKYHLQKIDAICAHGHTVFHQPEKAITLQIGNTPLLAQRLGCTVVCDFRAQDVALGGQGAPLVPIGDRLLFSEYTYCLNIGGFANISFEEDGKRIAFDICPANTLLNHYAGKLGKLYDADGAEAARGAICQPLLEELNALPFYTQQPPKSLGIEWVLREIFPRIEAHGISVSDTLRTLTEHIALQISRVLKQKQTVLVTGGGAHNIFLMNRLHTLSAATLTLPEKYLVDFKEALIFGLLGVLRLRNEVNCLRSVTGASKDHSSGKIFEPS